MVFKTFSRYFLIGYDSFFEAVGHLPPTELTNRNDWLLLEITGGCQR